jgi:ubiquinone biosynthesis protein
MGIDPKDIALKGFRAYMKQIFIDGFFHGDPHPGNLMVTRNGELVFLDYGLIGLLRSDKKDKLLKLILAILDKDVDDIVKLFKEIGVPIKEHIEDSLKDDLYLGLIEGEEFDPYQPESGAFEGVVQALRRYRVKIPMTTMLMIKVVSMIEADAHFLYPQFNFMREIRPYLLDIIKGHIIQQVSVRKLGINMLDGFLSMGDFPRNINDVLKRFSSGNLRFRIAHDDIDRIGKRIDQASNRILLGVIFASLLIGISVYVYALKDVLNPLIIQLIGLIYIVSIFSSLIIVILLLRGRK